MVGAAKVGDFLLAGEFGYCQPQVDCEYKTDNS